MELIIVLNGMMLLTIIFIIDYKFWLRHERRMRMIFPGYTLSKSDKIISVGMIVVTMIVSAFLALILIIQGV